MTGLAAGIKSGFPVFEAQAVPGGICSSYYLEPGSRERKTLAEASKKAYRFEYGGGHWIFGGDAEILDFIGQYITVKKYSRSSAVYLPARDHYVPYPLQYHLSYLDEKESAASLKELAAASLDGIRTMEDWVRAQFGSTLNTLFFAPFHELYTAGLWSRIRPQDNYKTPLDINIVKQGAADKTPAVGYNATFVYPEEGLDGLALKMADACDVRYDKRIVRINTQDQKIVFQDGQEASYDKLFSSLPLNEMVQMAGMEIKSKADPHTAVLVMNIGAVKGPRCPDEHWIYVPSSDAGFHRVGFYSNVDSHFLPADPADGRDRVSLYIERAFLPGEKPSAEEIKKYEEEVVSQLQAWGMIETAEAIDSTWVEVAYTWSWPDSNWIDEAIDTLRSHGIEMLGRYGRWHFQGIASSIREGLGIKI
ncbi:MAG: protoporphyrinogen oxidase-like protein [Rhodothermales bacterium]